MSNLDHSQEAQTRALVVQDFALSPETVPTNATAFFELLCDAIAYMIEHQRDRLMSTLYRLDIDEAKINYALSPFAPDAANIELARLVMARQAQRVATKASIKVEQKTDLWDFMDED